MRDFLIISSSLKSRWLNSLLSVFLTAFGVMMALLILQFSHHIGQRLHADGKGIDIVVGAKGSPLQLILSSVYHIDIPTGNIPYKEAQAIINHPHVKTAIPLALGDNWNGYRIVGTKPEYLNLYTAEFQTGGLWNKSFDAIAGANVGLKIGDEFSGAHGLGHDGHVHDNEKYNITGVLKPTGTVLDRLIITSLDSVLTLHGHKINHGQKAMAHSDDDHIHTAESDPEITALLISVRTPLAKINLPHKINRESNLQAANPALEMARLTSMLGLGSQTISIVSFVLITIAALSIFSGLTGSLENRMNDLAVLRALGYSRSRILKIITMEGMLLVVSGLIIGLILSLGMFWILSASIEPFSASGAEFHMTFSVILVMVLVMLSGLIAAIIPAIRAAKVDVARQLTRSY